MYSEENYDGEGEYSDEVSAAQPSFVNSTTRHDDDYTSDEETPIEPHMFESDTAFRYKLPDEYIKDIRYAWYDNIRGTQFANEHTLGAILRHLGFTPTYNDVRVYLYAFDRKSRKEISFASLCEIIKSYMQDNNPEVFEQTMVEAFRVFDNEQEGYVNTSVIRNMLLMLPEIREPKNVERLLREMDENGEGYISYESFVSTLCELYKEGLDATLGEETPTFTNEEVKQFFNQLPVTGRDDGEDNPEDVADVLAEAKRKREEAKAKRRERRKALKAEGALKGTGKRRLRRKKKKGGAGAPEDGAEDETTAEAAEAAAEAAAHEAAEEAKRATEAAIKKKKKLAAKLKARRAPTAVEDEEEGVEMAEVKVVIEDGTE